LKVGWLERSDGTNKKIGWEKIIKKNTQGNPVLKINKTQIKTGNYQLTNAMSNEKLSILWRTILFSMCSKVA
jgi:hypothetical protein